jgi:hypothetical protein
LATLRHELERSVCACIEPLTYNRERTSSVAWLRAFQQLSERADRLAARVRQYLQESGLRGKL